MQNSNKIEKISFNLNGEITTILKGTTIEGLLAEYGLDKRKIAVEKNLEIVTRSKFSETEINEADNIEIIHFIGGG